MRLKAYEGDWPAETLNVVLALRIIVKWMAQNKTPSEIVEAFESKLGILDFLLLSNLGLS
jgi:hypothetical protein